MTGIEYEISADEVVPKTEQEINQEKYIRSIQNAEFSNLLSFHFSRKAEKKLTEIITALFAKQARAVLMGPVFHLLKELIINATKANYKKVAIDLEKNSDDFTIGKFREMLRPDKESYHKLKEHAKAMGLWVKIKAYVDEDGAYFLIKNNLILTEEDDNRLRNKLKEAMQYDSLPDFYLAQSGEQEGAGIGFAMIITALKGLGLDGKHFTIGNENNITVARLHLPFHSFDSNYEGPS